MLLLMVRNFRIYKIVSQANLSTKNTYKVDLIFIVTNFGNETAANKIVADSIEFTMKSVENVLNGFPLKGFFLIKKNAQKMLFDSSVAKKFLRIFFFEL